MMFPFFVTFQMKIFPKPKFQSLIQLPLRFFKVDCVIAVVDTDDRTFLLPDRLCQRTVIISNIIIAAEPLHILFGTPLSLVFSKHILIHITLCGGRDGHRPLIRRLLQLPQLS